MIRHYPYAYLALIFFAFLSTALPAQTLFRNIGVDSLFGIPAIGSSSPEYFTALNDDQFVFQGMVSPVDLGNLHVSDGTTEGTQKLGTVTAEGQIIRFQDRVYFAGNDLGDGQALVGLWATDGTTAGTELIFASNPADPTFPLEPKNFFALDTLLIFSGLTTLHGEELWATDGTTAGTRLIADVAPGTASGFADGAPAVIDGILYFTGFTTEAGAEPWRTDGTPEGTYMIADMNPGPQNSGAFGFTASGGYIYFSALTPDSGREVRRMTAEQGSTIELIGEGGGTTDSSSPQYFVDADGTLFWAARSAGSDGFELRSYDHIGEPTTIEPTDIFPQIIKPFGNGRVVFKAHDAAGTELWISDGTSAGTRRIKDLYPGPNDGIFPNVSAESFHVHQDSLVYYAGADGVAADGEFVYELFVTDGTEEGTKLVADQMPGTAGSNPGNFFTFKDRIYFAATDSLVGREPFYLGPGEPPVSIIQPPRPTLPLQARAIPNPAPAGAEFRVELNVETPLKLTASLYDLRGGLIRELTLPAGMLPSGQHSICWQLPAGLSAGAYFIRFTDGALVATLRLLVVE